MALIDRDKNKGILHQTHSKGYLYISTVFMINIENGKSQVTDITIQRKGQRIQVFLPVAINLIYLEGVYGVIDESPHYTRCVNRPQHYPITMSYYS